MKVSTVKMAPKTTSIEHNHRVLLRANTLPLEAAELLSRYVAGEGTFNVESTRREMERFTAVGQRTGKGDHFRSVLEGNLTEDVESLPELLSLHGNITRNARDEEVEQTMTMHQ